jgi:glyoxylase-like metal-dependent hydrolase (beta-lactamase superfamily II)
MNQVSRAVAVGLPLLLLAGPGRAESVTQASYAKARQLLDAAIQAAGGLEALQGVKNVSRRGRATAYNQGQGLVVEPPYSTRSIEIVSVVDLAGGRSSTETRSAFQGGIATENRAVLAGDTAFGVNLVTNVVTPGLPAAVTGLKTALRRDPATILLTASGRAETLRDLGEDSYDGRPHRVVTFADSDGTQIALYFDAGTSLLSKYETFADNPVLGDTLNEVVFSDYRSVGGVKLPFRVVNRTAGETVQETRFSEVLANTPLTATLFEPPAQALRASPAGPPSTVVVKKVGEDAYVAEGSGANSLFVVFNDHVLLVEAPTSEERSRAVMAKIAETAPGKPVKYVVPTHHHYDHTGGLRAMMAAGATVVTTPGNKAFVERVAATPHTLRPDGLSRGARRPAVETFARKRVFTDGAHTVEIHDIGPNPHANEIVIAYLPKDKVVFESDVVSIPAYGPLPPANPSTVDFVEKLKTLGLQVETIAPGHGRVGTLEEVKKTLPGPSS